MFFNPSQYYFTVVPPAPGQKKINLVFLFLGQIIGKVQITHIKRLFSEWAPANNTRNFLQDYGFTEGILSSFLCILLVLLDWL